MAFLHGVETITLKSGARIINAVPSAIPVLIGIAPIGPKNVPTLVAGTTDAAQFGSRVPGFNIPEALNSIFAQGSGIVIVINVFDNSSHTVSVTNESVDLANGKFNLAFAPVGATRPVLKDAAGAVTFVEGTDYTLDDFGNGVVLSTAITGTTAAIKATYKKLDTSAITASLINGAVDGSDNRTGMECADLIPGTFGFKPKIFIAPGYSHLPSVSTKLLSFATKYKGIALLDAPEGTTVSQAIAGRAPSGTFGWNTSSSRAYLLYPSFKKSDPNPRAASNATITESYSALMAGVIAANDNDNGFWVSPSNKEIKGIVKPSVVITCSLEDSTAQNQLLNAAGITTYFNSFGTSIVTYGNRSAMFPSDTQAINFVCVQRTKDILEDSVVAAQLPFVDQPINKATIDAIRQSVNNFILSLIQRGALIDGSCVFNPNDNPPSQMAAGQLVFTIDFMSPTPAERITFNTFVDVNLLSKLLAS